MDNLSVLINLKKITSRYTKAIQQIVILDEEIRRLEVRLNRSARCVTKPSLKLRLSVLENTRNAFYFYAQKKCMEFNRVRELNAFKIYRVSM